MYQIVVNSKGFQINGPFSDEMHSRVKRAGGIWLRTEKAWYVSADKADLAKVQKIVALATKAAGSKLEAAAKAKAEKEAAELAAKALEVSVRVDYDESDIARAHGCRWDNGRKVWIAPNQAVADLVSAQAETAKSKRVAAKQQAQAARDKARQEIESRRELFFLDRLPSVGVPIKIDQKFVVIESFGKTFRYDYESFGCWRPERDGDLCCYGYYRAATEEEIAQWQAAHSAKMAKLSAQNELESIVSEVRHIDNVVDLGLGEGERIQCHTGAVPSWFIIGSDWIGYSDQYTLSEYGHSWRVPHTPELEARIRDAHGRAQ